MLIPPVVPAARMQTNPSWWTDQHASNWAHVRDAMERDWEQTKADFSAGSGHKLNQNVADTVQQAMSSAPVPPLSEQTRPTDPKVARAEADAARETMQHETALAAEVVTHAQNEIALETIRLHKKVGEIREDLADHPAMTGEKLVDAHTKASDEIAAAQDATAEGIAKERVKIDEAVEKKAEAVETWHEAESGVRYGYSVRSQYPAIKPWDETLEQSLKGEWEGLDSGTTWHVSRAGIYHGWKEADKA